MRRPAAAESVPVFVGGKSVVVVGTLSTGIVSLTDLTGGIASRPASGDYVVSFFTANTESNRRPTLTITGNNSGSHGALTPRIFGDATYDCVAYAFGQRMGATPDTEVTRSGTGNAADWGTLTFHVWRGIDEVTPMDVTPTTAGGTPGRPNPPAITPVTDNAVILAMGGAVSNAAFIAGYLDNLIQSLDATEFAAGGIGSVVWPGGTYDPAAWTGGYGSATYAAATIALRPGAPPPPPPDIEYVGGTTLGFVGGTVTGTVPLTGLTGGSDTQPRAGDLVVVAYCVATYNRAPTLTISGNIMGAYENLTGTVIGNNNNDTVGVLFAEIMGATPDTSLTRSATGNVSDGGGVIVMVFRNISATYLDVPQQTASGGGGQPDPPPITPITPKSIVLSFGASNMWHGSDTDFVSSDLTEGFLNVKGTDSQPVRVGMGFKAWTSGEFDPELWSGGNTSPGTTWAAGTIAIRPV